MYLDLETTGLFPWKNGIIQIAGEIEIDGVTQERFNFSVKPFKDQVIEDGALKVNKTTREELESFDAPKDVFKQFITLMHRYIEKFDKKDKFFMVGYDSHAFDTGFLREFFKRNGEKYFGLYFWQAGFDVMMLAAHKLAEQRPEMPNFKLMTVAKEVGIELDEDKLHDAMYDVDITKEIYKRII